MLEVLRPRAANSGTVDITFNTTFPAVYTIGKPGIVEWSGGNGTPVNVSLSDGDIIQTLCINTRATTCSWTPAQSIQPYDTYLLEIDQGGEGGGTYSEGPVEIDAATDPSSTTSSSLASSTSVPTSSPTVGSTAPQTTTTVGTSKVAGHGLSGGAIAGIVIGVLAIVCIVVAAYFLLRRRRASRARATAAPKASGYEKPELDGNGVSLSNNNGFLGAAGPLRGTGSGEHILEDDGGQERFELADVQVKRHPRYEKM